MTDPLPEVRMIDAETPQCVHHWMLGDPISGRIVGRCRRCDASKVFPASLESTERFDDYRELVATKSYYEGERRSA